MQRRYLLLLPSILAFLNIFSQGNDSTNVNYKKRQLLLGTSTGALTLGSLITLNQAWYSQYNTGKFHFFDDNQEWLQMDKAGHAYTTYQMSRLMMDAFDWAGFDKKKSLWVGGTIGFVYMTAVECMDGFSKGWGYSWGDQAADIAGTALAIGQHAAWRDQKIQLKFSYSRSGLAKYNPSLLGENRYSQILKDYNGQTYWVCVNPSGFMKSSSRFPKWIALALGYGAYGMLGGHSNPPVVQDENGNTLKIERERRIYLSLDIDLTKLPVKSKILRSICSVFAILKFPAPALEFSRGGGFRFYALYY